MLLTIEMNARRNAIKIERPSPLGELTAARRRRLRRRRNLASSAAVKSAWF